MATEKVCLEALEADAARLQGGGRTGVLYPILLRPEVAALAMSGSTVLVAVNALLLKRYHFSEAGNQQAPAYHRSQPRHAALA